MTLPQRSSTVWSADSYQSSCGDVSNCSSETSDQAPLPPRDNELASLAQQQLTQLHVLYQQGVIDDAAFSRGRRKVLRALSEGTAAINVSIERIEPTTEKKGIPPQSTRHHHRVLAASAAKP
eukprot:TRINITY_DN30785_c0_g1_i1.p1 TRINITY_DN30785_c0_g1~~TRINITY_DN30785_c0_g1_i1.p1  ORF type:complete len:122 (+),score=24.49 TRINITY_DN30785_c0_g1_i1:46-411(+)